MGMTHIAGSSDPVTIVARKSVSTNDTVTVEVEGPYSDVAALQPAYGEGSSDFDGCPAGFTVAGSELIQPVELDLMPFVPCIYDHIHHGGRINLGDVYPF